MRAVRKRAGSARVTGLLSRMKRQLCESLGRSARPLFSADPAASFDPAGEARFLEAHAMHERVNGRYTLVLSSHTLSRNPGGPF